ncbi:MAG: MaoC family dehydratase N-terminal domain-containing protein, partial [Rhodoferax sp.]|nr:MaoC family dehydratase N-terminal domain-containing protein [Rhodoferax sp.]
MNLDHVISLRFADTEHDYGVRDTLLYALSLGMASDPLDGDELPYAYEGLPGRALQVVPTQAVVLGWQPFWHDDPAAAIDWKRIVHGEQHLRLHAPLPAAARVRTQH